jgi:hypothetical protein
VSAAPTSHNLTDADYWDSTWTGGGRRPKRISSWHPIWGRHGLFPRVTQRHVGSIAGRRILEMGAGGYNYRLDPM